MTDRRISHRPHVWVWLCLLLCWCIAYAAPLARPHAMALVCSSTEGVRWVNVEKDADIGRIPMLALDCPQCLPTALPPPPLETRAAAPELPEALPLLALRDLSPSLHGMPPPARGPPPSFS